MKGSFMKCLCFSDSHGNPYNIRRVLNMHPDAEVIFFLGDGLSDLEPFVLDRTRAFLAVRGNCDGSFVLGSAILKKTDEINLLGKRIVFTHGDLYGVKYSLDGVKKLALERGVDLVLFGHTHMPLERYDADINDGVYFFNPGSIATSPASYGVMNITEKGILLSHGIL